MSRVALLALLAQYVGAWKFEDGPGRSWEVLCVPPPHTCFAVLERRRHRLILRRDSSCIAQRPLWQGPGDKPKIVCHVDTCNSLWSMSVREDQLVGYFGADVSAMSNLCHAGLCMGVHFEQCHCTTVTTIARLPPPLLLPPPHLPLPHLPLLSRVARKRPTLQTATRRGTVRRTTPTTTCTSWLRTT